MTFPWFVVVVALPEVLPIELCMDLIKRLDRAIRISVYYLHFIDTINVTWPMGRGYIDY